MFFDSHIFLLLAFHVFLVHSALVHPVAHVKRSPNQPSPQLVSSSAEGTYQRTSSVGPQNQSPKPSTSTIGNGGTAVMPEPDKAATVTCTSPQGKIVTFKNRECYHAAKVLAEELRPTQQCGLCVVALYDRIKHQPFTPKIHIDPPLQNQVLDLLAQCTHPGKTPKVSKRDLGSSKSSPPQDITKPLLLISYNDNFNYCKGL
ncbi:hypothetical protein O181_107282 [Austropuccinia psidii MF-1]|uniref:Saposin B-type domain-containing protein n=1 Tax=Austropuccinia psidii MF-1 TaxID=1389203 RepID=A0A9Q3JRZ4_9BASI|nr:hypothetical protein [Austropuccinia psidii MF-1]